MKKLSLLLLVTIYCISVSAQCDKPVILTSSKTEYLDEKGDIKKVIDEKTTIEISKSAIVITPGDKTMTGVIDSANCAWKVPFKEGKSVYATRFTDDNGEVDISITIEGKEGKISFVAIINLENGNRIRVWPDTFQEKK